VNAHRQAIESAWDNLLEAVQEAAQEARTRQSGKAPIHKDIAPKLETLQAALRGLSNAWTGIRDLLPTTSQGPKNDVPGALPQSAYLKPLAQALHRLGDKARATDAIKAVGEVLGPRFKQVDRDPVPAGQIRWIVNTRYARLNLKERGLISAYTPYGYWELTEAGIAWAGSDSEEPPQRVPQDKPGQQLLPF
jgi:hypothetical protein